MLVAQSADSTPADRQILQTALQQVHKYSAISIIKTLGRGAWLSKVDIESAFRIIPLHPSQWHLLGMSWNGQFYFDKRLTMGERSSPFEFDKLPTALE